MLLFIVQVCCVRKQQLHQFLCGTFTEAPWLSYATFGFNVFNYNQYWRTDTDADNLKCGQILWDVRIFHKRTKDYVYLLIVTHILGIRMRRMCLMQSTWKVEDWRDKLWRSIVQTTVLCCSSPIPFMPGHRAKWVVLVLERKSSPFTFVLPSFIPLLSTQLSSVFLHSFSGLPSSSILQRVFHHEHKCKKRGDTWCRICKLCLNPYISIVNP